MPSSDAPPRNAPPDLWREAQRLLNVLHNLFGAPETIAAEHTLTRKAHALLLSWIRVAEAMLRRLLLIEAAAYSANEAPAGRRPFHRKLHQRRLMQFFPEKPEDWRVTFRCFSGPPAPSPACSRKTQPSAGKTPALHTPLNAWPLAERFEALIRVFNDPAPYAKRLARRLRAAPQRIRAMLTRPWRFVERIGEACAAQLETLCESARPAFNSS